MHDPRTDPDPDNQPGGAADPDPMPAWWETPWEGDPEPVPHALYAPNEQEVPW